MDLAGDLLEHPTRCGESLETRPVELTVLGAGRTKDFPDRGERRALTVGRAATDEHPRRGLDLRDELSNKPRLSDPRIPDDRHQASAAARGDLRVDGTQPLQLLEMPRKRRVGTAWDRGRLRVDGLELERRHFAALAFQRQRLQPGGLDGVRDESMRRLPEQDLPGRGGLFEALADGNGIAADEPVSRRRVARHDLAGVDADPYLQTGVALAVELRDAVTDRDCRTHRAESVVLVNDRNAKDRHHLVADELLDGAAVLINHRGGTIEEAGHDEPKRLGVELLGQLRVGNEITEKDGYQLSPLRGTAEESTHVANVTATRMH